MEREMRKVRKENLRHRPIEARPSISSAQEGFPQQGTATPCPSSPG